MTSTPRIVTLCGLDPVQDAPLLGALLDDEVEGLDPALRSRLHPGPELSICLACSRPVLACYRPDEGRCRGCGQPLEPEAAAPAPASAAYRLSRRSLEAQARRRPPWRLAGGLSLGRAIVLDEDNEDWDDRLARLAAEAAAPDLDLSWKDRLEALLHELETAPVSARERQRLSKDPGQAEVNAILAKGPKTKRYQRATRRLKRGNVQGAIDDLTAEIERNPNHPNPWTRRGIARARTGDLEGAVADYTAAIQRDRRYLPAWANRGSANYHLRDYRGTDRDCTRTIELAPNLAKAWLFRGMARAQQGRGPEAAEDLFQFLDLSPYSPYVRLVRQTLKQAINWDER